MVAGMLLAVIKVRDGGAHGHEVAHEISKPAENRPLEEVRRIPLFPPLMVDTFVMITFFLQGEREAGELPAVDPPRHPAQVCQGLFMQSLDHSSKALLLVWSPLEGDMVDNLRRDGNKRSH